MGEVDQEQRHVCRICSKICVSGKSLGGHMRVHLAQISASRKVAAAAAAQEKSEIKVECDDDDDDNDQESCMMKQCEEGNVELGDGDDQSSSYELRENPKKSWKFSDPKHGLMLNSNSCKECGKEFTSLRALSGHMRCHSIKSKKELHLCRECGRGFDSMRAMFGHMKSHSKMVKKASAAAAVESAESLSDLENSFCPIRRKRSRIRYKGTVNPSFSGVDNASNSAVSELEEVEEAAMCLVMLSRGAGRSCLKLNSNAESSEDDSAYFGGGAIVASCGSKRFCGSGSGFLIDDEKKLENVSEFDELGLKFVAADQTKIDLDLDHDQASVGEFLESGFGMNGSENEDDLDLEMMEDFFEKRPKYKHNKMVGASSKLSMNASLLSANQADPKHDQESGSVVVRLSLESSKSKERECPICFKVFTSGQALGGHKRAHYNGVVESKNRGAAEAREMLDLNFPISGDAGATASLGLSSWFAERSCEHEALVLTT